MSSGKDHPLPATIGTEYLITSHDKYQMRGRKTMSRAEEHQRGSYLFTLIDIYGLEGEKT